MIRRSCSRQYAIGLSQIFLMRISGSLVIVTESVQNRFASACIWQWHRTGFDIFFFIVILVVKVIYSCSITFNFGIFGLEMALLLLPFSLFFEKKASRICIE